MSRTPRKRHLRHSAYERTARSKHLREFLEDRATDLNATGSTTAFTIAVDGDATITAHGLEVGEGPFVSTTTGVLPDGMDGLLLWVHSIVDDDTVKLSTSRGSKSFLTPGDTGTGIHSLVKADSDPAIYEYLKQNRPEVVLAAVSVDTL